MACENWTRSIEGRATHSLGSHEIVIAHGRYCSWAQRSEFAETAKDGSHTTRPAHDGRLWPDERGARDGGYLVVGRDKRTFANSACGLSSELRWRANAPCRAVYADAEAAHQFSSGIGVVPSQGVCAVLRPLVRCI